MTSKLKLYIEIYFLNKLNIIYVINSSTFESNLIRYSIITSILIFINNFKKKTHLFTSNEKKIEREANEK